MAQSKSIAATAAKAEPRPIAKKNTLLVADPSCTADSGPRAHDMIVGGKVKKYVFNHAEALEMDRSIALKFLKAGFDVTDHNGNAVAAIPSGPSAHSTETFKLAPNEVVARYDELSIRALVDRCNQIIGGERMTAEHGKKALIRQLRKERARIENVKGSPDGVGDNEVADMSPAELKKLMGDTAEAA